MTILSQIWRRLTTTRHTRALECELVRQGGELARQRAELTQLRAENDQHRAAIAAQQNEIARHVAEIARLRAENRALLNSILGIAGIPPVLVDTPLPSSVPIPAKCHSESAAADDESRSRPSLPSITAAEKNSPGPQSPRNDIPPKPSPESSSLRSSLQSSPTSPPSVEGQGFSPDTNDRAERAAFLPKALAEGGSPQRHSPPRRQIATPLRRRSWHQITRTLELESGRKKRTSD